MLSVLLQGTRTRQTKKSCTGDSNDTCNATLIATCNSASNASRNRINLKSGENNRNGMAERIERGERKRLELLAAKSASGKVFLSVAEKEPRGKTSFEEPVFKGPIQEQSQQNIAVFKNAHKIKTYGLNIPSPITSFNQLSTIYSLRPFLLKNLAVAVNRGQAVEEQSQEIQLTPIQAASFPILLSGRDLIACAPTGSGKTMAYLVPILHLLRKPENNKSGGFRALIIAPTMELSLQIHRVLVTLTTKKPFKTLHLTKQTHLTNPSLTQSLKTYDILISTPLRLVHAVTEGRISLDNVRHLVLDEADKLLELGFQPQIATILQHVTHPTCAKSLFSATISSTVEEMGSGFMTNIARVVVGHKSGAIDMVDQRLIYVGQEDAKPMALRTLHTTGCLKPPTLIFVDSITRAQSLFHELVYDGVNVDVIHSNRTALARANIIENFRRGRIWVLIATEVLGRGIDFRGVEVVINYDFPTSVASYVHRIGRTGRAGRSGVAYTFFTKQDGPYLKSIASVMKESGCHVPDWIMTLKPVSKALKQGLKKKGIERGVQVVEKLSRFDKRRIAKKKDMVQGSKNKVKLD